jgi:hypothetical protein
MRTAALRQLVRTLIDRFGMVDKEVADEVDESQSVFSDYMRGARAFQPRHMVALIALFRRFQVVPVDPKAARVRSHIDGFAGWSKADEFDLMWTFIHGERPNLSDGEDADRLVERRMFTLGGHKQEALIYEFVPEGYQRRNIHCAMDPAPLKLPEDSAALQKYREVEARETKNIKPPAFNGSAFTLSYIRSSRTAGNEEPTLTLRFKPSDYVRRRTTRSLFSEMPEAERDAILSRLPDGVEEVHCGGFGAVVSIITADHKLLFFKRSGSVAGDRNAYDCTITEGSDGINDFDEARRPSVIHNAIRGLHQEASLHGHQDFIYPRLRFHGVLCRARFYEWAIYGSVDLSGTPLTAERLAENAKEHFRSTKKWDVHLIHTSDLLATTFVLARDSFEFQSYAAVPFSLADVVRFIATKPITDYAFVNAVMTLISVGKVSATAVAKELSMYPPRSYAGDN